MRKSVCSLLALFFLIIAFVPVSLAFETHRGSYTFKGIREYIESYFNSHPELEYVGQMSNPYDEIPDLNVHPYLTLKAMEVFKKTFSKKWEKIKDNAPWIVFGSIEEDYDRKGTATEVFSLEYPYSHMEETDILDWFEKSNLGVPFRYNSTRALNHFYSGRGENRLTLSPSSGVAWLDAQTVAMAYDDAISWTLFYDINLMSLQYMDNHLNDETQLLRMWGHALHVLEDMASPPHVRDDNHASISGNTSTYENKLGKLSSGELDSLLGFQFQNDAVIVCTPRNRWENFEALSNRIRARYFSDGTIFSPNFPIKTTWRDWRWEKQVVNLLYKKIYLAANDSETGRGAKLATLNCKGLIQYYRNRSSGVRSLNGNELYEALEADDSPISKYGFKLDYEVVKDFWIHRREEIVGYLAGFINYLWDECYDSSTEVIVPQPPSDAWPMYQHDAQHTGRSPFVGPQTSTVRWTSTGGAQGVTGTPVIAQDGTIYVGLREIYGDVRFAALNPDGSLKWRSAENLFFSTQVPAIANDGTVYVGTQDSGNKVYAFNPDGTLQWDFTVGNAVYFITVGPDGTIYFTSETGILYALNPEGSVKWTYRCGFGCQWTVANSAPAIGPDKTVYVTDDCPRVYAFNPDGSLKWEKGFHWGSSPFSSIAITADGTLYVTTNYSVSALSLGGESLWGQDLTTPCGSGASNGTVPIIASDGTVIVTATKGIVAFSPDGTKKWEYCLEDGNPSQPIVDAEGTIYVGVNPLVSNLSAKLLAINSNGTLKWGYTINPGGRSSIDSPPVIAADGTLYISIFDGESTKLYAFRSSSLTNPFQWREL